MVKKPFLTYASRDFLCYLRQMGFKTFNDYWSEEYDGFEFRDRYLKLLQTIDELAKRPIADLRSMYHDMQHILNHNYNLLRDMTYNTQIEKIL